MKRFALLLALAMALTACAAAPTAATPETAPAASSEAAAAESTADPAFTVGRLRPISQSSGYYSACSLGDELITLESVTYSTSTDPRTYWQERLGYPEGTDSNLVDVLSACSGVLLYADLTERTQAPLCSVPGCDHTAMDCPARYVLGNLEEMPYVVCVDRVLYIVPSMYETGIYINLTAVRTEFQDRLDELGESTQDDPALQYAADLLDRLCEIEQGKGEYLEAYDLSTETRTQLAALPEAWRGQQFSLGWYDRNALYGQLAGADRGVRISLQDGTIQYFDLMPDETILDGIDDRFLTARLMSDVALPTDPDASNAVLQNAWWELDLLDPATGEREKVSTWPYSLTFGSITGQYLSHDYNGLWFISADAQTSSFGYLMRYDLSAKIWETDELNGADVYYITAKDWLLNHEEPYVPYLSLDLPSGTQLYDVGSRALRQSYTGLADFGDHSFKPRVLGQMKSESMFILGNYYDTTLALTPVPMYFSLDPSEELTTYPVTRTLPPY